MRFPSSSLTSAQDGPDVHHLIDARDYPRGTPPLAEETFSKAGRTPESEVYNRKRKRGRRYAADLVARPLICFADVIGRTLIAFEPAAAGVKKLAEGSISGPIFRGRPSGNFLVLSRSGYPLILPFSPVFRRLPRRPCVPSVFRPPLDIGFSNGHQRGTAAEDNTVGRPAATRPVILDRLSRSRACGAITPTSSENVFPNVCGVQWHVRIGADGLNRARPGSPAKWSAEDCQYEIEPHATKQGFRAYRCLRFFPVEKLPREFYQTRAGLRREPRRLTRYSHERVQRRRG